LRHKDARAGCRGGSGRWSRHSCLRLHLGLLAGALELLSNHVCLTGVQSVKC
jgi:hypothetical protein